MCSLIVKGTDYYVKNTGNDSNSGLSDAQAWAHHPWMSTWTGSVVLKPGDKVYMKRGNTWTIASPSTHYMTVAQSGTAGNYITTTAYGTGPDPIINISTATNDSVIYADAKSYLTFDNLHILHIIVVHMMGLVVIIRVEAGIYLDGYTNPCHDITITNCEFNNIPHACVLGNLNCYNITIGDVNATSTATDDSI